MSRKLFGLVVLVGISSFIAERGNISAAPNQARTPTQAQSAIDINQAIKGLSSVNPFEIMNSLRTLAELAGSDGTERAVAPVSAVLLDENGRFDSIIRAMAAGTMGLILKKMKNKGVEEQALEHLIQALHGDLVDQVRVSAATALGSSGNTGAVEDLKYSMANDPSLAVREAARVALVRFGAISVVPETPTAMTMSAKTASSSLAISNEYVPPTEKEIIEYLNAHSAFPIVSLPYPE